MAGWGAFVGREGELSRLQLALAARARLVLVVGDAGIGKTRLVGEGLRRATRGGWIAVGGGCLPLAEKLPLLPVADALGELSRLDGGGPFEAALEAAPAYVRPEVARLLPRLGTDEPAATGPVEGWRHERLFAGVGELLGGVARRSAVALLIEDRTPRSCPGRCAKTWSTATPAPAKTNCGRCSEPPGSTGSSLPRRLGSPPRSGIGA
jgi:AAA ATPase domain